MICEENSKTVSKQTRSLFLMNGNKVYLSTNTELDHCHPILTVHSELTPAWTSLTLTIGSESHKEFVDYWISCAFPSIDSSLSYQCQQILELYPNTWIAWKEHWRIVEYSSHDWEHIQGLWVQKEQLEFSFVSILQEMTQPRIPWEFTYLSLSILSWIYNNQSFKESMICWIWMDRQWVNRKSLLAWRVCFIVESF